MMNSIGQTDFKINTPDATVGQLYGLQQTRADIQTRFSDTDIAWGLPVINGTKPKVVKVATAATTMIAGIVMRQTTTEADTRPSLDGETSFPAGRGLGILTEGRVVVKVKKDAAKNKIGAKLNYDPANKEFVADAAGVILNATLDVVVDANQSLWAILVTNAKQL